MEPYLDQDGAICRLVLPDFGSESDVEEPAGHGLVGHNKHAYFYSCLA
jgi:hypothetical protein